MRLPRRLAPVSATATVVAALVTPLAATASPAAAALVRSAAVTPSPTGSVSLFAGGFGHGAASSLRAYPTALAYGNGELYVAERTAPGGQPAATFVRRVDTSSGATTIVAGGGSRPLTDLAAGPLPATDLRLGAIGGLAVDGQGRLVVGTGTVFAVTSNGDATPLTLPSIDSNVTCAPCDGQPGARPTVAAPDVATGNNGALLLAEREVYRVDANGRTTTLVGGWASVEQTGLRENVPSYLASANAISVAPSNTVDAYFITKRSAAGAPPAVGDAVRQVAAKNVTTVAQDSAVPATDPSLPTAARISGFGSPLVVRPFSDGLLVGTTTGVWHRSSAGAWNRLAGGGAIAPADSAAALGTSLVPSSLAQDGSGGFFASTTNQVWHVDSGGVLHLVEGTGAAYGGDGGQATDATFASATSLVRGPDGTTYISDSVAHVIRAVAPNGQIRTFAGTGSTVSSGDGGPAKSAGLGSVGNLTVDGSGNVYLTDGDSVRKIDSSGTITTVAGNGTTTPDLEGPVSATATSVIPTRLAAAPDGTLYIGEYSRHRLRKMTSDGTLTTFLDAQSASGGLNLNAVAVDGTTVYVSDGTTQKIWRSVAGGPLTQYASLGLIQVAQLVVDNAHHLYAQGSGMFGVVRVESDGTLVPVNGKVVQDGATHLVNSLTFPIAPIEAIAPYTIASDGAGGLLASDYWSDVFDYASLGSGVPVPPRPTVQSVSPSDARLQVNFSPTGGSSQVATSFTVTASPGGASVTVPGTATSATLTGLTNGTTYSVTVQATNASGTSYPSKAVTGTPQAAGVPPSAPTGVADWPLPNGKVRVVWTAPASSGSGPITGYAVRTPQGLVAVNTCSTCTLSKDLPAPAGAGVMYTVVATSAGGSTESGPSNGATAAPPLQAPTNVRILAHDRNSTVVWDSPPVPYANAIRAVCASTASGWGTCTSGDATALNLRSQTPGAPEQVTLQVGNESSVGTGTPVSVTTATAAPPATPSQVDSVSATTTWHAVHATWTPAATGSPVRDFIVTLHPEGRSLVVAGNQLTADFTGVPAGTSHWVSVAADGDGGLAPVETSNTVNLVPDPPGLFHPVPQARVYGPAVLYNGLNTDQDVLIAGKGGIPADADAVLVNIEVQSPTQTGYLRVTPGGSTSSTAVQEFAAGQTISNLVAVKLDSNGKIRLHLSAGRATVFVDVAGSFTRSGPGDSFLPVPQARVYGPGSLAAGTDRDIVIAGHGGIPADADAVLVNVEVQAPTKAGYLRVTPGGSTSATAVQEFAAGQTISNLVAVKLGTGGTIRLHLSAGVATVFVDVAGAYVNTRPADSYQPVPQARVYGPGSLTAGGDRDVVIAGHGGIPASADAVLVNVEVQSPTKAGYLRVTPGGSTSSTAVQEFAAGQTISNLVAVKLGPGGTIRLHLSAGTATVFVDVAGAFISP